MVTNSDTITNTSGSNVGKRVTRFIIGTSTAGWTKDDCDYLCDGTADDVEINAAIQALPENGGKIIILDGTYNITTNILVNKRYVTISGNGTSTKLIRQFASTNYSNCGVIQISAQDSVIEDLLLDNNKANYTDTNYTASLYVNAKNCKITKITCVNSSVGVFVNSSEVIVTNSNFYNCTDGVKVLSGPCTVSSNTFSNCGIGVYLTSCNLVTVSSNVFNGNTVIGVKLVGSTHSCTIIGNIFYSTYSNFIGVQLGSDCKYIIISNNVVKSTQSNAGYAIQLNSGASYNIILGNFFLYKTYQDNSGNNTSTIVNNIYRSSF